MSSSISLQNRARCTAEFKPNCRQQSQTVGTKWCLLASYTLGRFPSWVGSELENCQASTKCRCANMNLAALLCKELSGVSNRHSGGAVLTSCYKKLHSVHTFTYRQQMMVSFCCGWPNRHFWSLHFVAESQSEFPPLSLLSGLPAQNRRTLCPFWQRKSCFEIFFLF